MLQNIPKLDEFVKGYLLFRGFGTTFKSFESELKTEKDRTFRVDKIMDQMHSALSGHDLQTLRDLWGFLNSHLFCRLEQQSTTVKHLEANLLKLYVILCYQSSRNDKVKEFFDKLGSELHCDPDWREWFSLAFVKCPEDNPVFSCYLSRPWQDTFLLSLANFLAIVIHYSPIPQLLDHEDSLKKILQLEQENQQLKEKLAELRSKESQFGDVVSNHLPHPVPSPVTSLPGTSAMDLIDDFHGFEGSQDDQLPTPRAKDSAFRGLFRNLGIRSNSPNSNSRTDDMPPAKSHASTGREPLFNSTGSSVASSHPNGASNEPKVLTSDSTRGPSNISQSTPQTLPPSSDVKSQVNAPQDRRSSDTSRKSQSESAESSEQKINEKLKTSALSESLLTDAPFVLLSQDVYEEHHAAITHCRFNTFGHTVASLDADGVVKVWNLQPSPVTVATVMSRSALLSLEWASSSGQLVLLGSKAGNVRVFDVAKKKIVGESVVDKDYQRVCTLCCDPQMNQFACSAAGRLIVDSADNSRYRPGQLSVWDVATMTKKASLITSPKSFCIGAMVLMEASHTLMAGDCAGNIFLYDLRAFACQHQWKAHTEEILSLAIGDGHLYSVGAEVQLKEWSLYHPGVVEREMRLHSNACGPFIVSGSGGFRQVHTPKDQVFALSPTGKHFITCDDKTGLIYQVSRQAWEPAIRIGGHCAPVVTVDWTGNQSNNQCLTASMDGKIRISTLLNK